MSVNKQCILDNVEKYSAQELVEYIQEGIVSFNELVQDTDGQFAANKRKEVKILLENGDTNSWEKAQNERTIDSAKHYLKTFPYGEYRNQARSLIEELEKDSNKNEIEARTDDAWALTDKSDLNSLRSFINSHPDNGHITEANGLVNKLLLDEIMGVDAETLVSQIRQFQTDKSLTLAQKNNNITDAIVRFLNEKSNGKESFLKKIQEDHNLLNAGLIKQLINKNILSLSDFIKIGIDKLFIEKTLNDERTQVISSTKKFEKIHKQSTEVYFWGIPSSGKSCALGAILSVADSGRVAKTMVKDNGSQGYRYMTKLINLFQDGKTGTLMEGTPVDSFYEMGFDLVDSDDNIHPITCIDMAGELMCCMYKASAGDDMTNKEEIMLDTLTKVLIDNRSVNRKMHIFVIEYGGEDKLYEGMPQKVYLDGTLSYIENTGIFKKDTDAIYIMITKADKIKNATKDTINNYINDTYLGFYNGLEKICKDNGINKGKVEKIAFTLGEVCFQNFCKFDSRAAENVVNIILKRSASCKGGKLGKLNNFFKG